MAYHQQQMQQYQAMIAQNMAMQMINQNGTAKVDGVQGQNQANPFAMGMNPQMNLPPMGGFPMMPQMPMQMPGAMPGAPMDPSQAPPMMPMMGMPMMYPPFPNANQT
jgi:hypothetical protein